MNESVYFDIILPSDPIRFHRVSNNDQWDQIGPGTWYKKALQWPLHFEITNDPINDTTKYRCILHDKTLEITFLSSFLTEEGMSIYIMNEASDNKPFDIHSIEMTYSFTTLPPTPSPTAYPTTPRPTTSQQSGSGIVATTTARPTLDGQISSTNTRSTVDGTQSILRLDEGVDGDTDSLTLYLAVTIVVLVACFVVFCAGFWILYKRKRTNASIKSAKYDGIPNAVYADILANGTTLNAVPSRTHSKVLPSGHQAVSSEDIDDERYSGDFNEELGNIVAVNAVNIDDIVDNMVTAGGSDEDIVNMEGLGRHDRLNSDGVREGGHDLGGHELGRLLSEEKEVNYEVDRTRLLAMAAMTTRGFSDDEEFVIGDDQETAGDQP